MQGASTELNLFAQGTDTLGPNNGVIEITQGATLAVASPLSGNSTIESDGSATVFFVGGLGSVTFEGTLTFDQSGFAADALTLRGTQPGSAGVLNMIGHVGGLTGGGTIDNGESHCPPAVDWARGPPSRSVQACPSTQLPAAIHSARRC